MIKIAQILDILGGFAVFAFIVWTTYFALSDYILTFWRGVGVFAILFLFTGAMHMIPYIGASALPVAWEWLWHDISLSDVSGIAWTVVAFSLSTKVILNVVVTRQAIKESEKTSV